MGPLPELSEPLAYRDEPTSAAVAADAKPGGRAALLRVFGSPGMNAVDFASVLKYGGTGTGPPWDGFVIELTGNPSAPGAAAKPADPLAVLAASMIPPSPDVTPAVDKPDAME